jgi:hypothetical protein
MKKIFTPIFFALLLPLSFSCSSLKGYTLNETDAANAIRQLLGIGARDGALSFNKETIMSSLFPEDVRKVLNTVQQLGLTNEVDRFSTTVGLAAEKTANRSIPIFVNSINDMQFMDAIRVIKNGGTSATEYLRSSAGTQLRQAIKPVMQEALDEYKLNEQWNKIVKPVSIAGVKLNVDLSNLMAGLVSEAMFRKIEEKEREIRANAYAQATPLLKKVFSRDWN